MCSFSQLSQRMSCKVDHLMVKQWMIVHWEKCLSTTRQEVIKLLLIRLQNYKLMIFDSIPKVPKDIM